MRKTWKTASNILCIRLDSMGDVLMTSPAMRALKNVSLRRSITLLTSPAGAGAASLIPEIDEVIVYEAPWMKATSSRGDSQADLRMVRLLENHGFDSAVIFTAFSQSPLPAALLAYLANIPLRLACCRENPYQLLTDWVRETEPQSPPRHEVRRQLDLVASVGYRIDDERMRINVPPAVERAAEKKLQSALTALPMPWLVIHPGASAPSRRYAPEQYATVTRELFHRYGLLAVFTGSTEEISLVEGIRAMADVPSISLAGALSIGELAAILARAPVLIANNTGPAHLAAAAGTPVVDIYALTNPQHTPWGVPNRVLFNDVPCKYCYKSVCPEGHHDCLRLVTPDMVVAAAYDLLSIPTVE